jgi:hypothetical protein
MIFCPARGEMISIRDAPVISPACTMPPNRKKTSVPIPATVLKSGFMGRISCTDISFDSCLKQRYGSVTVDRIVPFFLAETPF